VFRLAEAGGLELIEIAPGVDLERDILARMGFAPAIAPKLRPMEARLFGDAAMGLRQRMLSRPLAERIELDPRSGVLFIDFEGLSVESERDIDAIESEVAKRLEGHDARVDVVVNYDHFSIRPELIDAYAAMVDRLTGRYYHRVTRYAASGFLKARLAP
jgi:propionate CoA-transferase